jgi:hypothetical protein
LNEIQAHGFEQSCSARLVEDTFLLNLVYRAGWSIAQASAGVARSHLTQCIFVTLHAVSSQKRCVDGRCSQTNTLKKAVN